MAAPSSCRANVIGLARANSARRRGTKATACETRLRPTTPSSTVRSWAVGVMSASQPFAPVPPSRGTIESASLFFVFRCACHSTSPALHCMNAPHRTCSNFCFRGHDMRFVGSHRIATHACGGVALPRWPAAVHRVSPAHAARACRSRPDRVAVVGPPLEPSFASICAAHIEIRGMLEIFGCGAL